MESNSEIEQAEKRKERIRRDILLLLAFSSRPRETELTKTDNDVIPTENTAEINTQVLQLINDEKKAQITMNNDQQIRDILILLANRRRLSTQDLNEEKLQEISEPGIIQGPAVLQLINNPGPAEEVIPASEVTPAQNQGPAVLQLITAPSAVTPAPAVTPEAQAPAPAPAPAAAPAAAPTSTPTTTPAPTPTPTPTTTPTATPATAPAVSSPAPAPAPAVSGQVPAPLPKQVSTILPRPTVKQEPLPIATPVITATKVPTAIPVATNVTPVLNNNENPTNDPCNPCDPGRDTVEQFLKDTKDGR
jgi:hypothetical protein